MATAPSTSVSVECMNRCKLSRGGGGGGMYECNFLSCAWKAPRVLTGSLASTPLPQSSPSLPGRRVARPNANFILHGFPSRAICIHPDSYCMGRFHSLSVVKRNSMGCEWNCYNQISATLCFKQWPRQKAKTQLIKAVATVEPEVSMRTANGQINPGLQFKSNAVSEKPYTSDDDSVDMDGKERLRRMRISKANKGNVPWNKGRKHSPETLRRIRERTKIAMQNPKVKMKLVNMGHAQSEETRLKIGAGVREGWQRRREMLFVQETCLFEWQNIIAEASRKGSSGEDELQWDSYEKINEQLQQEWLESIEMRKTMPRPKGSKRAPKSAEQRRKISQAISAKWADPEYRGRVCSALAKYHGVPIGGERRQRRRRSRPSGETSSVRRERVKSKSSDKPKATADGAKGAKQVASRRKRTATPSYKDPMVNSKLEMIRKIRAERSAIENKKKEATERAKLLIAEAEKAAKALEAAALRSPLAQASLIETRKLIAEATRSIESIESGQLSSPDSGGEDSFTSDAPENHFESNNEPESGRSSVLDEWIPNSSNLISAEERRLDDEPLSSTQSREGTVHRLQVDQPKINGYKNLRPEGEGTSKSEGKGTTGTKKTKKWVCGRLVEVDE